MAENAVPKPDVLVMPDVVADRRALRQSWAASSAVPILAPPAATEPPSAPQPPGAPPALLRVPPELPPLVHSGPLRAAIDARRRAFVTVPPAPQLLDLLAQLALVDAAGVTADVVRAVGRPPALPTGAPPLPSPPMLESTAFCDRLCTDAAADLLGAIRAGLDALSKTTPPPPPFDYDVDLDVLAAAEPEGAAPFSARPGPPPSPPRYSPPVTASSPTLTLGSLSDSLSAQLRAHPMWRVLPPVELAEDVSSLRRLVAIRGGGATHPHAHARDVFLHRRCAALSWVSWAQFELPPLPPCLHRSWGCVQSLLAGMHTAPCASDALTTLVNASRLLSLVLRLAGEIRGGGAARHDGFAVSADEFLPAFILTVVLSAPTSLYTTLHGMSEGLEEGARASEGAYCLTHLASVVQFVKTADAAAVCVTQEEWEGRVRQG